MDQMVDEVAEFARAGVSRENFYGAWLERLIRATAAQGGIVWCVDASQTVTVVAEANDSAALQTTGMLNSGQRIRQAVAASSAVQLIDAGRAAAELSSCDQPPYAPLARCTVPASGHETIVAEILFTSAATPAVCEGALRVLDLFREVAVDYQRRRELEELHARETDARRLNELSVRLHGRLQPLETAYAIVNDGRAWLGCDRVSVAQVSGGRAKLLAVSGVDLIDPRAEEVARLERLATAVAMTGEPLCWSAGTNAERSPQIDVVLQDYVDRTPARSLVVRPLTHRACDRPTSEPAETIGVVIAESFTAAPNDDHFSSRVGQLADHAQSALGSALEHHRLPLRAAQASFVRLVRTLHYRRVLCLFLTVVIAVVTLLLTFVTADFTVEARGTLEPERRRNIFAPSDGVVERVAAEHGQAVNQGAEILTLRNDRLDLEHSRVSGELQTLRARLAAIRAKRSSRGPKDEGRGDERELAAEEALALGQIEGLENQRRVLDTQRADLHVTSPLDGAVLTWNAHDLLQDRPVRQGQLLLTLADPSGPWQLDLKVPDASIGHVLAARRQTEAALPVTFLLATDTAVTYEGHVECVALDTAATQDQTAAARVVVRIDSSAMAELRPGAGVIARVHCGRRSLGYVWLHQLIDAVRTYVLF